jgi:hypothetical protein
VHPKLFLSLWYVWRKPCSYLQLTLTPSPSGPKQDSIRRTSPRSSIRCVQNGFRAYGTIGANRTPILYQHQLYFQTDRNKIPHDPRHLAVPSGVAKSNFEPTIRSTLTVHLSYVNISTLSKQTKMSFPLTLITKE